MEPRGGATLGGMDFDLRAYARTLLKRKWIVAAGLLLSIGLGSLVTVTTPRMYQAKTTLFVGEQQVAVDRGGSRSVRPEPLGRSPQDLRRD